MRNTTAAVLLVAVSITSSGARAGILSSDTNGVASWQGTAYFDTANQIPVSFYTAEIDYSVYEPSQFVKSFGVEPDPTHYVYAYQVVAVGGDPDRYMNRLSVGLDDDEDAANIGYVSGYGLDPSNVSFAPFTAGWDFGQGIFVGSTSTILYFSSPNRPEWTNAAITGYFSMGDTQSMASPVPEPTTLMVFGMIALGTALRGGKDRRSRRRRRTGRVLVRTRNGRDRPRGY